MVTFKIDGKSIQFPTRWKDISFTRFIDLAGSPNDLTAQIAMLMDMTKEEMEKATFSDRLDLIFQYASFLRKDVEIQKFPTHCGPYIIGKEITTMGQLNAMSEQCEMGTRGRTVRDTQEPLANIAAIYCQGINEPFDKEKALYLGKTFLTYPCEDVLSTGIYFHSKAMSIVYQKPQHHFVKSVKFARSKSFFQRLWR